MIIMEWNKTMKIFVNNNIVNNGNCDENEKNY